MVSKTLILKTAARTWTVLPNGSPVSICCWSLLTSQSMFKLEIEKSSELGMVAMGPSALNSTATSWRSA